MLLLERDGVLQDLRDHLEQAAMGYGRLVLLRGEAGIGKTATVRRCCTLAGADVRVLVGGCDPLSTPSPLGPLMDIAAGLGPALKEALNAAFNGSIIPSGFFRSLLAELGGRQTTLLVLEDVHWADEATLDLVRFLGRRIGDVPALVVVTYRDDEVGHRHPLTAVLGDLAVCPAVHRCSLAPLSRQAVATLAAGHHTDVEELYRVTGGNPFFVTEALATDTPGIPTTVREAVLGRLTRLSTSAHELVEAAAVIGSPASLAALAAVAPEAEVVLEECVASGVLITDGQMIGFRHELASAAVLEAIPIHRRVRWHGRALAALRSGPVNVDDLARLAYHAEEAGDEAAVLVHAPRAAAHASMLGAHREAAAQYARALRHGEGLPPEQRATLLEGHSLECILTSQLEEGIASRRAAVELRHTLDDRLREGDDLRWLSYVLWPAGRDGEAWKSGLAAVQVLEELAPSPELAWAYVNLCELATYDYAGVAAAAAYAEHAVSLGEHFGDAGVIVQARFHAAGARLLCTGNGWTECEQAADSAIAQDLRVDAGFLAALMCWFAALQRDGVRAAAAVERAEAYCVDQDLPSYLLGVRVASSWERLCRGWWPQAAETAQAVLSHPSPLPFVRALALTVLGLVRARRGDSQVWPLLDEGAGLVEPGALMASGLGWEARTEAAWLAGDDVRAQAEAAHGLAAVGGRSHPWLTGALACWIQRAGGVPPNVPAAEPYALELTGDWAAAAEAWEARGFPYEAALACLGGNADAAAQALATFEYLDARPATVRARKLLRAAGRPVPRRGRGSTPVPAQLRRLGVTSREADVLALLAEGLSNRQIADRLVLSPRTVEKHVEHLMAKTDSANRAALATYVSLLDTSAP